MSHITTVETRIYDREVLLQALEKLGISWVEDRWVQEHNDRIRMDIVIRGGRGSGTGFHRPGNGKAFQMHSWGGKAGNAKRKGKILQEYARIKILKEARRKRYGLVRETVCSGNRIQLVLRKVG
jgi:hypothetical protein